MIRSTIATEELIGLKISSRAKPPEQATHPSGNKDSQESGFSASVFFLTLQTMIPLNQGSVREIYTETNKTVGFRDQGAFLLINATIHWDLLCL